MDQVSEAQLREIERRIVEAMIAAFEVDLSGLVLDMTNFATWIDSGNTRAPIAQRGHSKQKRNDLRICGLGLVVSRDGGVPLVSHAYPGNKPDVTQFAPMVRELAARFEALGVHGTDRDGARLTLVYDAGQNSEDNYEVLDGAPLSFVGSLPPSDHPDLLAVPADRYGIVDAEAFPLGSDPHELYNLFSRKLDTGWMFLPVFKAIGESEASVTLYPNIKPGQEFEGYATGTGSADKVLAQLVPGPFAAITRSVRKTPGRRSASCGAEGRRRCQPGRPAGGGDVRSR